MVQGSKTLSEINDSLTCSLNNRFNLFVLHVWCWTSLFKQEWVLQVCFLCLFAVDKFWSFGFIRLRICVLLQLRQGLQSVRKKSKYGNPVMCFYLGYIWICRLDYASNTPVCQTPPHYCSLFINFANKRLTALSQLWQATSHQLHCLLVSQEKAVHSCTNFGHCLVTWICLLLINWNKNE